MPAGRGFIALAVALQFRLQARAAGIPYPVLLMFPYPVRLGVLAFAVGRAATPANLGRAYQHAVH